MTCLKSQRWWSQDSNIFLLEPSLLFTAFAIPFSPVFLNAMWCRPWSQSGSTKVLDEGVSLAGLFSGCFACIYRACQGPKTSSNLHLMIFTGVYQTTQSRESTSISLWSIEWGTRNYWPIIKSRSQIDGWVSNTLNWRYSVPLFHFWQSLGSIDHIYHNYFWEEALQFLPRLNNACNYCLEKMRLYMKEKIINSGDEETKEVTV